MARSERLTPRWGLAASDEDASLLRTSDPNHEHTQDKPFHPLPRRSRFCRLLAPAEPHQHAIRPILPSLQRSPLNVADRLASRPLTKRLITGLFFLIWLAAFALPVLRSNRAFLDPDGEYVKTLNCDSSLWTSPCGLDGEQCRPFVESYFTFRCPANCARTASPTPRPVGPLDVVGRPLVVGSTPFRADSYICSAAIMASVVSDARGGCGRVTRVGKHDVFVAREANGVESIGFDSYFPYSFTVSPDPDMSCEALFDPRPQLLGISLFLSTVFSLFVTSAAVQFFVVFVATFLHVGFVSDPPPVSPFTASVLPELASSLAQNLPPAMFLAAVLYGVCIKRTLEGLTAQFEKVLLWLGGLWLGALANYTLDWIPTQSWGDYELGAVSQPVLVLAALVAVVGSLISFQMYCLWTEGRLERYLLFYLTVVISVFGLLCLPGVDLQLQPYIVALVFLPATAMQTRTSLLTQGLLLGILIHGLAHAGFSPLLIPRDPSVPSPIPYPTVKEPVISFTPSGSNITLAFDPPPATPSFDGISVTVNDVERFTLLYVEVGRTGETFTWDWPNDVKYDEYFRYGFIKDGKLLGYGPADTWFGNGTFARAGDEA